MSQCTAKSKRSGEQCRRAASTGRSTCRMHGGTQPVGLASPNWTNGRYSRVLPKRLLEDVKASLADPNKLALSSELALLDARTSDLLLRVESGESGQAWRALGSAWQQYETASRSLDTIGVARAIATIGDLITRGYADSAAWSEVSALIERRRKLVETERKRQISDRQMVTTDQALALLALLVTAVQQHVHDDDALRAITDEYARLTGLEDYRAAAGKGRWDA